MNTATKQRIIESVMQFMQSEIERYEVLVDETIPANQRKYYANIFDRGDCLVVQGTLMIDDNRGWEHPTLDEIVKPYGLFWEWESPEAIVIYCE